MKITFILPTYPWKPIGGFKVVYEYANALVCRGHSVTIVHARKLHNWKHPAPPNLYYWLRRKAGDVRSIIMKPKITWHTMDPRVNMIYVPTLSQEYFPDGDAILATFWPTAELLSSLPERKGVKFYLIQDFDHYFGSRERLETTWKLPYNKITVSRWLYEKVVSYAGENNLINIPNGINHSAFRKISAIQGREMKVSMMYSFSSYKQIDDGIEALSICKKRRPDMRILTFGSKIRPHHRKPWIEHKLNATEDELVDIYNKSRVFICSSLAEGFAFPPAEAMACGCAVASTDCGGNRDYAKNEVNALISKPNDPESLAKNIIRLLDDEQLRIKIATAGYETIQKFSWEQSTKLLENFLKERTR